MTQPTTTTTTPSLTTTHFQTAIQTFLDETKPDLLTRHQIQQLHVEWEPHARESPAHQHDMEDEEQPTKEYLQRDHPKRQQQHAHVVELDGTLRLSSEYIALFVRVSCRFLFDASTPAIVSRTAPNDAGGKTHEDDQTNDHTHPSHHDNSQIYREDLHVRIHAKASFLSLTEFKNLDTRRYGENGNDADPKARKQGLSRKERATRLKLRNGMMQRLRSDPFVRKLLVEGGDGDGDGDGDGCNGHGKENGKKEKYGVEVEGQPLCEVRIQQIRNGGTTDGNDNDNPQTSSSIQELEERVDVHEPTLEGMRRALFSQWDDNLDVLEFLLHMPFFPRKVNVDGCIGINGSGSGSGSGSNIFMNWFYSADGGGKNAMNGTSLGMNQQSAMNSLAKLGERAYLRVLEDAMFDACEKEGEDEILDDLTISGRTTSDDGDFDDEACDNGGRSNGVLDRRGRYGHESHLGGKSDVDRCQKMRGKPLPNAKRARPL